MASPVRVIPFLAPTSERESVAPAIRWDGVLDKMVHIAARPLSPGDIPMKLAVACLALATTFVTLPAQAATRPTSLS
ncbi:hypothetical protein, partial [Nonomuraea zeae]|uniref:hypothetical protein n=1 Tax=Nonomuraea zeae TaxID=1642303 RepID=UPI00197D04DD